MGANCVRCGNPIKDGDRCRCQVMPQSDLDTATLIRRLTEDLEASRRVIANQRDSIVRNQESVDSIRQVLASRGWVRKLTETIPQGVVRVFRDIEHRLVTAQARAESAEHKVAMLEAEVGQAKAKLANERTSWHKERQAAKQLLGEMRNQPEGGRDLLQCISDHIGKLSQFAQELADARLALRILSRDPDPLLDVSMAIGDALKQLAKVEWSALRRPDTGGVLTACCPLCCGVRPGHEVVGITTKEVGHRSDCWYAKNGSPGTHEIMPGVHVGMRDKADGSFEISALHESTHAGSPPRPPRFAIGHKIWYHNEPGYVVAHGADGLYFIRLENSNADRLVGENALSDKPAPRFAVGEWVTWGKHSGEVVDIEWVVTQSHWLCHVQNEGWIAESQLTAQTQQYKHDCAGCVFLGRYGTKDLWVQPSKAWVSAKSDNAYVRLDVSVVSAFNLAGDAAEALRRAKIRGLAK